MTIAEAAPQIQSGRLHPRELVERCLAQIAAHDGRLHAWVEVDEAAARRDAESLGREAAAGNYRGPLHGIPVGIKDIIDVAGMPTRAGSPLRAGHVATADAPLVAALRRAGAIILGKTVTVEFACFDPSPTRNPWDPDLRHTPGGSSSGSAVAVLMGMCLAALGTQTGGSLVRPAGYCGIAACKPTFGLLSREGIVPVSRHFDHPGPMARSAADLEIVLRCLVEGRVGQAERSPTSEDENMLGGTALRLSHPTPLAQPPRLGLLRDFFFDEADAAIRETTDAAVARIRAAGAKIRPAVVPDDFRQVAAMHRRIMAVDAAAYHRAQFAAHRAAYGPMIAELLDEGLAIQAVDYADALDWQRRFARRVDAMFDRADVLVCPATDTTAPATLTTTGTPKFQAPWSCAGVPVVSLPCGLAKDGMPTAIQLVGPRGRDAMLLQVAQWCERALAFDGQPPPASR
jgi:Asp-tRNA(Asn)/Glu-tRNA(Gln) amidotransferase A subunit family amidase